MNIKKKGPQILIISLVSLLLFILGIQYGKSVERADKTISYLLSITPTPSSKPYKPTLYKRYSIEGCSMSFVLPDGLKEEKISSKKVIFSDTAGLTYISIDCGNNNPINKDKKEATASLTLLNKHITVAVTSIKYNSKLLDVYSFNLPKGPYSNGFKFIIDRLSFELFANTLKIE